LDGESDEEGKPIEGSGTPVDRNISEPQVTNDLEAELSYWLNDWLKAQQKGPSKKTQSKESSTKSR
jgi:hypothetical protein